MNEYGDFGGLVERAALVINDAAHAYKYHEGSQSREARAADALNDARVALTDLKRAAIADDVYPARRAYARVLQHAGAAISALC